MSVYHLTEPPLSAVVKPKTQADQERLSAALERLAADEPSVRVETGPGSGQMTVRVEDELRLDALLDRLHNEFGVAFTVGAPQVAYRETILDPVENTYTHSKPLGPMGQFAQVTFRIEPGGPTEGYLLESEVSDDALPAEYIPGVERGVRSLMDAGPLGGFPVIGVRVTLLSGQHHPVDSSIIAFEIASRICLREAFRQAGITLLEPVMAVEVTMPGACTDTVLRDLAARRGTVQGQGSHGLATTVSALVPLANLMGYPSTLLGLTKGQASFTSTYAHHTPVERSRTDPDDQFPGAMAMRA